MKQALLALLVGVILTPSGRTQTANDDHSHHDTEARGNQGMGFGQDKTTHHFLLRQSGGAIQVTANSPQDNATIDHVRMHLEHIAGAFQSGDFNIPGFVHDQTPPGVPAMIRLNVAWERFNATTMDIRIRPVGTNGIPGPAIVVDQKVPGGDSFLLNRGVFFGVLETETDLQGEFRDLVGLDLAVDHSGGPNDGTVYVTWDDGRSKSVPDLAGFTIEGLPPDQPGILLPFSQLILTYAYTDVLVSRSRDGVHFEPAVQVNSDRQPKLGGGHDHFQPAIATDSTGHVAICWYDRRNDPKNFAIERFCAESKNRGNDWTNFRVPVSAFSPLHRLDFLVNPAYMGDYDGLTSDFTGKTKGFIGAFEWMSSGMNPDVKAFRFD